MYDKTITCFLIDDDKDDQEIFDLALRKLNMPVAYFTADDGYIALQKFEQHPDFIPDIIFLDLNMPRVNGLQCLMEIKKEPRLRHIPVIMYTTSSTLSDKQASEMLGAQGFITKFTRLDELATTLKSVFEQLLLPASEISIK